MGFIRNDDLKIDSLGITLSNTYYTFCGCCSIQKRYQGASVKYFVNGHLNIYASKQHYLDGKQPIPISFNRPMEQQLGVYLTTLTGKEPMKELYDAVKISLELTDTTDDL